MAQVAQSKTISRRTYSVNIDEELTDRIDDAVKRGVYRSRSDAFESAIRRILAEDDVHQPEPAHAD